MEEQKHLVRTQFTSRSKNLLDGNKKSCFLKSVAVFWRGFETALTLSSEFLRSSPARTGTSTKWILSRFCTGAEYLFSLIIRTIRFGLAANCEFMCL